MSTYLKIMKLVILFTISSWLLFKLYYVFLPSNYITQAIYFVVLIGLIFYSGREHSKILNSSIAGSGYTGVFIFFIAHPILNGGNYLVMYLLNFLEGEQYSQYWDAFLGILLTFLGFSPIAALIAILGCIYERKWGKVSESHRVS